MKKFLLFILACSIILYLAHDDFKFWVNGHFYNLLNALDTRTFNESGRDKYGLLSTDYDKNGWAIAKGKWVSNPRAGAIIKYSGGQVIATSSAKITNTVMQNNPAANPYRNFSSIEETYPILERVARDLEYSDIGALRKAQGKFSPLPRNHYYEADGKRFYSQQAFFDYEIQKAVSWGSRNDQNNDGVINCMDYAELFYKYALEEGYHVRYISNSRLNHAFNGVNVKGSWITIEPQSAESGLDRSPLVSRRFPNYNPFYDTIKKQM